MEIIAILLGGTLGGLWYISKQLNKSNELLDQIRCEIIDRLERN